MGGAHIHIDHINGWDTYIDHVQWVGHIIDWTYIDDLQRQDKYSNHKVGSTHRLQQNREN